MSEHLGIWIPSGAGKEKPNTLPSGFSDPLTKNEQNRNQHKEVSKCSELTRELQ